MAEVINLRIELEDQFLKDVMCTMIESGMGSVHYWGKTHDVVRDPKTMDVLSFKVTETDASTEGHPGSAHINSAQVAKAIQHVLNGNVKIGGVIEGYISRSVREGDAGDIDSDAADVLAQVIVLNEVVYG